MIGHSLLLQESSGLGWERVLLFASPNQQPHTCRLGPGVCSLINFQPPPPLQPLMISPGASLTGHVPFL